MSLNDKNTAFWNFHKVVDLIFSTKNNCTVCLSLRMINLFTFPKPKSWSRTFHEINYFYLLVRSSSLKITSCFYTDHWYTFQSPTLSHFSDPFDQWKRKLSFLAFCCLKLSTPKLCIHAPPILYLVFSINVIGQNEGIHLTCKNCLSL